MCRVAESVAVRAGTRRRVGGEEAHRVRPAARAAIRRAIEGKVNPIEILLAIAADEGNEVHIRVVAAAHACPYMYPRTQFGRRDREPHNYENRPDSADRAARRAA